MRAPPRRLTLSRLISEYLGLSHIKYGGQECEMLRHFARMGRHGV